MSFSVMGAGACGHGKEGVDALPSMKSFSSLAGHYTESLKGEETRFSGPREN